MEVRRNRKLMLFRFRIYIETYPSYQSFEFLLQLFGKNPSKWRNDNLEGRVVSRVVKKHTKIIAGEELERINLVEEASSRQKSRVLWLREGDKCRQFFHRVANSNWKNNSVNSVLQMV